VVQILTTFQTVLAPLGLQASAGKQRVLISRPQPNRFIPGQDSACEKSTRVCPALALSRSDKVRKDSHTRLVCPIPATRGLSPNVSPGHWLSVSGTRSCLWALYVNLPIAMWMLFLE